MSESAQDRYQRWQSEIDRAISEMLEQAQAQGLPGEGRPLRLDDNEFTPNDQRMAFKLLKDNEIVPEWIMRGKDLEAFNARIKVKLLKAAKAYRMQLSLAQKAAEKHNAEKRWQSAQQKLQADVERYNDQVLSYNLVVPAGISHRKLMRLHVLVEAVLAQLDE